MEQKTNKHSKELIEVAQSWFEEMVDGNDQVIGIFGRVGSGKSTSIFLPLLDIWYNVILKKPPNSMRFAVHIKDWDKVMDLGEPYDFCGLDECGDLLNKKDGQKRFNKIMYQTFTIIRGLKYLTVFVMPQLWDLDSDFRNNRLAGAFVVDRRRSNQCKECLKTFAGVEKCPWCGCEKYKPGFIDWSYYPRDTLDKMLMINANMPKKTMYLRTRDAIRGRCYEYKGEYRDYYDFLKTEKMDMAKEKLRNVIKTVLNEEIFNDVKITCPQCNSRRIRARITSRTMRCELCGHIWPMADEGSSPIPVLLEPPEGGGVAATSSQQESI